MEKNIFFMADFMMDFEVVPDLFPWLLNAHLPARDHQVVLIGSLRHPAVCTSYQK